MIRRLRNGNTTAISIGVTQSGATPVSGAPIPCEQYHPITGAASWIVDSWAACKCEAVESTA